MCAQKNGWQMSKLSDGDQCSPEFVRQFRQLLLEMGQAGDHITINGLILSEQEICSLTGYKKPQRQLQELVRQGFFRARQSQTTGHIILERAHFEAVSSGNTTKNQPKRELVLHRIK